MSKKDLTEQENEEIIEIFVDFRRGLRTLDTASKALEKYGFVKPVAEVLLKSMKRDNVIDIRGYLKMPEKLLRGKQREWEEKGYDIAKRNLRKDPE